MKKIIQHAVFVSAKHYFDMDEVTCKCCMTLITFSFGVVYYLYSFIMQELHDGLLTVKYDVLDI